MLYKIRHKNSGLFLKPTKRCLDINLSKRGKVYQSFPSIDWYVKIVLGYGEDGKTFWKSEPWEGIRTTTPNHKEFEVVDAATGEVVPWRK